MKASQGPNDPIALELLPLACILNQSTFSIKLNFRLSSFGFIPRHRARSKVDMPSEQTARREETYFGETVVGSPIPMSSLHLKVGEGLQSHQSLFCFSKTTLSIFYSQAVHDPLFPSDKVFREGNRMYQGALELRLGVKLCFLDMTW